MIRKKKSYAKPRKKFERARIEEEDRIIAKYGLKNKREIWKTAAKINYFRSRAKTLAGFPLEEQDVLFGKLRAIGLNTNNTADVLDLKVEDLLERRLPTVVLKKKLANTINDARQKVVHKKILVDGRIVDSPGFIVPVSKESSLTLKVRKKKPKSEEPKEEANELSNTEEPKEKESENGDGK